MKFEELNLCGYKYRDGNLIGFSANGSEKVICNQLIYPSKIIYNLEDETYKVELHFIEDNQEKTIIVDKETIASKSKIITLSNYGIYVNSNNANQLITYLGEIIAHNSKLIPRVKSVSRMGWIKKEFVPYSSNIIFDGETSFKEPYIAISQTQGDFENWKREVTKLRKNKIVRLVMDASFASVLLEYTGGLPFVVLVWGGTGLGKTVVLKVAASIWGNPDGTGLINNLDSTTNFIYRTMGFYHDMPCFFDELQVFNGNKNRLIMTITQGIDRGKADKDKGNKKKETWKNAAIFTGEDSISSANSGGGTLNRLIEIYLNAPLFEDCMGAVDFVKENYGFAGREFVEYISKKGKDSIKAIYKQKFKEILALGKTADKQASSMANILTADTILNEFMFQEEEIKIEDIKEFLTSKEEIDISERAYDYFIDEVIKNASCFIREKEDSSGLDNPEMKREFWGSINNYEITILKSQFDKMIGIASFNSKKTIKEWGDKGYLIKNSQDRNIHQTTVGGIKGNFLKIKIIDREKQEEEKQNKLKNKKEITDIINEINGTNISIEEMWI